MKRDRADEVHELIQDIARERCKLDVREMRALREVDRLEVWRKYGYPDIYAYLEAMLGYEAPPSSSRGADNPTTVAHAQSTPIVMKRAPPDN